MQKLCRQQKRPEEEDLREGAGVCHVQKSHRYFVLLIQDGPGLQYGSELSIEWGIGSFIINTTGIPTAATMQCYYNAWAGPICPSGQHQAKGEGAPHPCHHQGVARNSLQHLLLTCEGAPKCCHIFHMNQVQGLASNIKNAPDE